MPLPKKWDREARTKLMAALLKHAVDRENSYTPSRLSKELADFRNRLGEDKSGYSPAPKRETVKNWLDKTTTAIGPRYAELVSEYLNEDAYEALTIQLTELERIEELQRFFGNEANKIEQVGPALHGDWLMYRRWRDPLDRYIVSPVSFRYSPDHRVITSTDTLHLRQEDAHFHDQVERWEGIAVPQGRFVYTIYRTLDARQTHINNLKFTVLDDISHSDETSRDGQSKLHIMSGFTMIGINTHSGGNSFITVLERVKKARVFSENPIPWNKIPKHVQDRIENRENSFMRNYKFS
jgi:hypothetical protein